MYRRLGIISTVLLLGAFATGRARTPVAEGADVVRSDGTVVFDANGTPYLDPNGWCQVVTAPNGDRNSTCHGTLPDGAALPNKAMRVGFDNTGFTCLGGTDWQQTVTPSGNADDHCKSRP